jgi:hypothetical protein
MLKSLASKVGVFKFSEGVSNDFEGNFYSVKVKLDVRKPLRSVVSMIRVGKRELFLVKFERLPNGCQVCGHLGHEFKDHRDGVHPSEALIFKHLRANWSPRSSGRPNHGRGGPQGGGRSGVSPGRSIESHGRHESNTDVDMSDEEPQREQHGKPTEDVESSDKG